MSDTPENRNDYTPSVSPYLLRTPRTFEQYLRDRQEPAAVPAKFDKANLKTARED